MGGEEDTAGANPDATEREEESWCDGRGAAMCGGGSFRVIEWILIDCKKKAPGASHRQSCSD